MQDLSIQNMAGNLTFFSRRILALTNQLVLDKLDNGGASEPQTTDARKYRHERHRRNIVSHWNFYANLILTNL